MDLLCFSTDELKNEKKIICFGAGDLLEKFLEFPIVNRVIGVIDNDKKKHGNLSVGKYNLMITGIEFIECINEWNEVIIVITSSYFREIFEQLENFLGGNNKIKNVYYFIGKIDYIKYMYSQKHRYSVLENLIVFRSGPSRQSFIEGMDFTDNARALYEYMLEKGLNNHYKIVWLVKDVEKFSDKPHNVEFLNMDDEESENEVRRDYYYKILYTAKYIFFTDAYGFASYCNPGQKRIQLWHGCGFKTRVNFARCENRYEYTTVVSELYAKIHAEIFGLKEDQVLITGYAKHDWIYKPYEKPIEDILGIEKTDKIIFWCPTFRIAEKELEVLNQYQIEGDTGLPIVKYEEHVEKLDRLLNELNASLIIKLHPFQKRDMIKIKKCKNIKLLDQGEMVEKDLMINRLLANASALISDYSSIAVDFLNCDKPLAFTIDDMEEYRQTRGFIFDNIKDYLPGKEIVSFEDFFDFVKDSINGEDVTREKRERISKILLKYKDCNNCERIIEQLGILTG